MLELYEIVRPYLGTIVALLVTIGYAIYVKVNNIRLIRFTKEQETKINEIDVSDKFNSIRVDVMAYIVEAENIKADGVVRKMLVKSRVSTLCINKGITFTDNEIDELVEQLIAFSKSVNAKNPSVIY